MKREVRITGTGRSRRVTIQLGRREFHSENIYNSRQSAEIAARDISRMLAVEFKI